VALQPCPRCAPVYVDRGRPLPATVESVRARTAGRARALLAAIERRRADNRAEGRAACAAALRAALWGRGLATVAGVDEAG